VGVGHAVAAGMAEAPQGQLTTFNTMLTSKMAYDTFATTCEETEPEQSSCTTRPVWGHDRTWMEEQNCLYYDCQSLVPRLFARFSSRHVLHVPVAGLPILLWSRSSKHFLSHAFSSLKLPLFDASAPSFDACSQCWL